MQCVCVDCGRRGCFVMKYSMVGWWSDGKYCEICVLRLIWWRMSYAFMQGMVIAWVSSCRLSGIGSWTGEWISQVVEWKHDTGNGMKWLCLCVWYSVAVGLVVLCCQFQVILLPIPSNSVSTVLSWVPSWGSRLIYHWLTLCSTLRVCSFAEVLHVNLMLHRKHFKLFFICTAVNIC